MIKNSTLASTLLMLIYSVNIQCSDDGKSSHIFQRTIAPYDSIIWAASKRDMHTIQRWIDHNPESILHIDKKKETALSWASSIGDEAIVDLILNTAEQQKCTRKLLVHENVNGCTALSRAAYNNNVNIVKTLLHAGRHVRIAKEMLLHADAYNELATDWAIGQGHTEALTVLLDQAEYLKIVPEILFHKNKVETNLLMQGVMAGKCDAVEQILLTAYTHLDDKQFGEFINEKGYKGRTALHCVSRYTQGAVQHEKELYSEDTMVSILKKILKYPGVIVTRRDDSGHTPAYWAAYYNQPKLLEVFEQYLVHNEQQLRIFNRERSEGFKDRQIDDEELNHVSKKRKES